MNKFAISIVASLCLSAATHAGSYEDWLAERQVNYAKFSENYLSRYQSFKESVSAKWGDKAIISTQHQYVLYNTDLEQRTILDYENNEIVIESLGEQVPDTQKALDLLANTSVKDALINDPILSVQSNKTSDETLLESITSHQPLANSIEQELSETDSATLAEQSVEPSNVTAEKEAEEPQDTQADAVATAPKSEKNLADSSTLDPTHKRINRVRIKLSDDLYMKRAQPYLKQASIVGKEYGVNLDLILAITQTESSFNPLAQSPIPAFGLMQIVPASAGLDVNTILKNKKVAPTSSLLFQPEENLEFGAGYLHILNTRYLKDIKNQQSRLYCIIAAYNTGAGNVASVFHPQNRKAIGPAVKVINTLEPEEVYQRLSKELPYKETQLYLRKVTKALDKFQAYDKSQLLI